MIHGHSCGSGNMVDILSWNDGSEADRKVKDLSNCKLICNGRAECAAFDHDTSTDTCGLWKRAPSKPQPQSGYNCYLKISGKRYD